MKIIHDSAVAEKFPRNFTVFLATKNYKNYDALGYHANEILSKVSPDIMDSAVKKCEEWSQVFKSMGAKPKYKSSLASLYEKFTKDKKLFSINSIVDFYNAYSLLKAFPMAAYDMRFIEGDLSLKEPGKGMLFYPLGSPRAPEPTKVKEVAYVDNKKVICRYWNMRDCDQTKVRGETEDILFIFDLIEDSYTDAFVKVNSIQRDFQTFFKNENLRAHILGPGGAMEAEVDA